MFFFWARKSAIKTGPGEGIENNSQTGKLGPGEGIENNSQTQKNII